MRMGNKRPWMVLLALILIPCFANVSLAGDGGGPIQLPTRYDTTTTDLNFRLTCTNDDIYIKTTIDSDEWVYVDFEMWFDDLTNRNYPINNESCPVKRYPIYL